MMVHKCKKWKKLLFVLPILFQEILKTKWQPVQIKSHYE